MARLLVVSTPRSRNPVNQAPNISWWALALSFLLLALPLGLNARFRLGLARDLVVAAGRMTLQLTLAGLYLGYLFAWNSAWITLAWLAVMILAASGSVLHHSALRWTTFIGPAFLSLGLATLSIVLYLNAVVIQLDDLFEARYLIVLGGMLLGNCLSANIIAAGRYYQSIHAQQGYYEWLLGNGRRPAEARRPFISESLTAALRPSIASMMTMGLVSLPGMMTGQMLGGSPPSVAIKYQIVIMLAIFTCTSASTATFLLLTSRFCFDPLGNLRAERILKKAQPPRRSDQESLRAHRTTQTQALVRTEGFLNLRPPVGLLQLKDTQVERNQRRRMLLEQLIDRFFELLCIDRFREILNTPLFIVLDPQSGHEGDQHLLLRLQQPHLEKMFGH